MAYNLPGPRIYQPDGEGWHRHFMEQAEGGMNNTHSFSRLKKKHTQPEAKMEQVSLLTPAAQHVEAAKVNVENERSVMDPQQFNSAGQKVGRAPVRKRGKAKLLKAPASDDIFL